MSKGITGEQEIRLQRFINLINTNYRESTQKIQPKVIKPRIQGSFTARRYFSGMVPHNTTPKAIIQNPQPETPSNAKIRHHSKQRKKHQSKYKPS